MKIWIQSDLHVSPAAVRTARPFDGVDIPKADLCVIAGDVTDGVVNALKWIGQTIAGRIPVLMVLGNHEFHGETWEAARAEAQAVARTMPNFTLLDDDVAVIAGVRVLGGTLWTDYQLYAGDDEVLRKAAMAVARRQMPDHGQIDMRASGRDVISRRFSPNDAREAHLRTRAFLKAELAKPFGGRTVLVTHHAPHPSCIQPDLRGDALSPAFASDLSELIASGNADLWIHGHVHHPVDVTVARTRILCNPLGYLPGNPRFDPRLVVEV